MRGVVDIDSIQWEIPLETKTPSVLFLDYNRDQFFGQTNSAQKIIADLSRVCELEDAIVEWYDPKYFQNQKNKFDLNYLKPFFVIKRVEYAGYDSVIARVHLVAKNAGKGSDQAC
jgi:hypothetical protein